MAIQIIEDYKTKKALERYGHFVGAMATLEEGLIEAEKLIERVDDSKAGAGFSLPTKDELTAQLKKVYEQVGHLRSRAQKHEADLISREWAVS
ncbi:hypothetical protein ACWEIJ_42945 [Lentzea sp. NPDC004789]